jgi:cellulose synthase/poly-beta-1,6-N-acetylglucosamine synthase-like glycosyltransferase
MALSLTSWPDAMTCIMIISVMLISVFSIWIIFFWLALQSMLQSPKLKSNQFKRNVQDGREIEFKRKPDESKRRLPLISVILPARDEQENIEKCIDSLVKQDYQSYEILAVNDCSADSTGDIMHKLASTYSDKNLTIIDLEPKPPGWVGKC